MSTDTSVEYVNLSFMLTIDEVAAALGVTERGVRLRIDLLSDVLDAHLRRGPKNQLLFDDGALAVLKRLEEIRRVKGLSLRQAAQAVREELRSSGDEIIEQTATNTTSNNVRETEGEIPWSVRKLIEELEKERDYWRGLALKLQEQVKELEKLALPTPKDHRPWWARGIFRWLWG
ncbi:MAG: hypothetical protein QXI12_03315 [Candidatus Methanomethyliaceae archaeon]